MPISALSAQQAKPTQATMKLVKQFLDYAATQEPAVTTYRASDMVLAIHNYAGYLNEEGARSCTGGHHFLSENIAHPSNNGVIYNEASSPPPPRPRLGRYISMHKKGLKSTIFWKRWVIYNPPLLFKQII